MPKKAPKSWPPLPCFVARVAPEEIAAFREVAAARGITGSLLARQLIQQSIADFQMEKNRENARQ